MPEAPTALVRPADGGHRVQPAGLAQRGLHLAELDALAEDLHLMVAAPEEGELAAVLRRAPDPVAGAVVDRVATRRHDERLRGALGVTPVAERHLRPGDQQLADLARRHLVQVVADDAGVMSGRGWPIGTVPCSHSAGVVRA